MKSFQSRPVTLAHLQTAGSCTLTLLVERPLSHTDTYSVVGHLHHQSLNETGSLQLYLKPWYHKGRRGTEMHLLVHLQQVGKSLFWTDIL